MMDINNKIGFNCIFMNFSSILQNVGGLPLSFAYTNFDFIYSPSNFTIFLTDDPPESFLSENEELVINKPTFSVFKDDYYDYIDILIERYNLFKIKKVKEKSSLTINELKEKFIDKNSPVMLKLDHFYLYEIFKENTSDIIQHHSGGHMSALVDINEINNTCLLVDNFFSYCGNIPIKNFLKAINSKYISDFQYWTINNFALCDEGDIFKIKNLLIKNIEELSKDSVIINNRIYYKNIKALKLFQTDLMEILINLFEIKNQYAPQFLVNQLQNIILQRVSFNNLLKYINKYLLDKTIFEIQGILNEVVKLWFAFDNLCDKCFLTGMTIIEYFDKIYNILNHIIQKEEIIYNRLVNLGEKFRY
jgi:hypothetical protein